MTESEIIDGCRREDRKCQRLLYERFAPRMYAVCLRYIPKVAQAQDVLQDSFIKIFVNITRFRMDGSLEGWIRRIVINTALYQLKKTKASIIENHHDETANYDYYNESENIINKISADEITRLIAVLPEGYRAVFNLSVIDGYSHHEIAEMLHITESTSRSQLTKARKMLQSKFKIINSIHHGTE